MSANSQLTTAVHALCWIELAARQGESPLTSERVAESLASNPVLVRRVLAPLRDAGIVTTGRGPGSGWRLGRAAEEISLRDVYEMLGAEPPFALHPHEPKPDCVVGGGIRPVLADIFATAQAAMTQSLGEHTVADVLERIVRPAKVDE